MDHCFIMAVLPINMTKSQVNCTLSGDEKIRCNVTYAGTSTLPVWEQRIFTRDCSLLSAGIFRPLNTEEMHF